MTVTSFYFKTFDQLNQEIQVNVNDGPERNKSLVFFFYTVHLKFQKALFSFKIYSNDASIDQLQIENDASNEDVFSVFYSFFAIKEILEFIRNFTKVDTLQFPPLSDRHQQNAMMFYNMIRSTKFRMSEYEQWCEISGKIPSAGSNKEDFYHRANLFQYTKSLGFSFDISNIRINNRSYVKFAITNSKNDARRKSGRRIVDCDDDVLLFGDRLDKTKGKVHLIKYHDFWSPIKTIFT
jgi:hypothetical protein